MHERGVPDRVDHRVGRQLRDPRLLVARCDRPHHGIDETGSGGIEFNAGLLDGGGHRRVRVHPRAQQLVRAEP